MMRFDDALTAMCERLHEATGPGRAEVTIVRDAAGRLTAIVPDDALTKEQMEQLAQRLHAALGLYSPGPRRILLSVADLIEPEDIVGSGDRVPLDAETYGEGRWLVDRLLTNQDWIRSPLVTKAPLPTGVGFSIKGGVGRSTALTLFAWHLARQGKRVLLVDLDLEAPGLGTMLLPDLPDFGVVDWCVESLVGQADSELFERMWRPAPLAADEPGSILVIPALGLRTQDFVAKVGRAYLPTVDPDGHMSGLARRFAALLSEAARRSEPPDLVLLDARAGLHDVGSAAVTQLGAEVFLFGRDEPASWEAYRNLFLHLRHSRAIRWGGADDDLRWRLKMVAAQTEPTEGAARSAVRRSYATWETLYDAETAEVGAPMSFALEDDVAPHYPLRVFFDPRVRVLDLVDTDKRPDWSFIESNFGEFFAGATRRVLGGEP